MPHRLIVLTGTESTGKTTLSEMLARHYGAALVPDISRIYAETNNGDYKREDVIAIAEQVLLEEEKAAKNSSLIITDNCFFNVLIWMQYYHWDVPQWIRNTMMKRKYHLHLLCAPDIPWQADPLRKNQHNRDFLHRSFQTMMEMEFATHITITGSEEGRFHKAIRGVDLFQFEGYNKSGNPSYKLPDNLKMTETVSPITVHERIELLLTRFVERLRARDASCLNLGIEAHQLANELGDKQLLIRTASELSRYYSDILSEFVKSNESLEATLPIMDDVEDAEWKSEFYRGIGLNHQYRGELLKAKEAYDKAVQLLENHQQLTPSGFLTLARAQLNKSIIYKDLNLEGLSIELLEKAYKNFVQADNKAGIARCYISFGVNIYNRGNQQYDWEKAIQHYQKAAELSREINDNVSLSVAIGNIGIVLGEQGQYEEGLKHVVESLHLAEKSANKKFVFSQTRQVGRIYHLNKNYEKADEYYRAAEKIFMDMNMAVDHYEFYKVWSDCLSEWGKYDEAFAKLTLFIKHKEELHQFNKQAMVSDAILRFQLEEGKKEQELLKRKNAEIEQYAHRLEASNNELRQFAHVASHDMKEPLRMVTNYSQILMRNLEGNLTSENAECLHYLNDGAKRMMNVINSLLTFSNLNSTTRKEKVDMNQVMDEVLQNLQLQIRERHALVEFQSLPTLTSDRVQMVQLMQNLVSNAIKYNKSDTPHAAIYYNEESGHHRFCVEDNGIGIELQYREKIFEMFQRLHNRNEYEGTGIGLSICKKIVENHSGKIWATDSSLGGIRICVAIPVSAVAG